MPAQNGLGPNHHYGVENRRANLRKPTQEDTVQPRKPNPARVFTPQDRDLMSQCDVLCGQPARSLDHGHQCHEEHSNERYHPKRITDVLYSNQPDEVFGRDRSYALQAFPRCGWTANSEQLNSMALLKAKNVSCGWTANSEQLNYIRAGPPGNISCGWTANSEQLNSAL